MDKIKKIFLTNTIPDFLDKKYSLSFIKFVFDDKTIEELSDDFEKEYEDSYKDRNKIDVEEYMKGLKSLLYLRKNRMEFLKGSDDVFIQVHDSNQFFEYLQELINLYSKRSRSALLNSVNFIRSIWLRMGTEDVENVELFLRKQIAFMKNERVLSDYEEFAQLNDRDILTYRINENRDWFETNKNIVFSIHRSNLTSGDLSLEELLDMLDMKPQDYKFPAIHFALVSENNLPKCYLYGIQQLDYGNKDDEIKEYIQPIRKGLRNKHVSSDILIALSLFFDFLYKRGLKDVVIPTMQVFNHPFHEQLSDQYHSVLDKYTEEEKQKMEERYNNGDRSDDVLEYMDRIRSSKKYMDRQDDISYNKSERLIYAIMELCERYPVLDVVSYPFVESENMHIKINGEINILNSSPKKHKL